MQFKSCTCVLFVSWIILSAIILLPFSNILFPKAYAQPIIPVVLRFYSFAQIENPDRTFRSNGEYQFRVTITTPGLPPTIFLSEIFDSAREFDGSGILNLSPILVDRMRGNPLITIQLIDVDEEFTGQRHDDIMDINPMAGAQTISLTLNLDRGTISGSLSGPVNTRFSATGNGDSFSDTAGFETAGERASVQFTVAVTRFQGWEQFGIGGLGIGDPGSSSSALNRWDAFQRGRTDGLSDVLVWTPWTGSMRSWFLTTSTTDEVFPTISSSPDAASFRPGRIDVFAIGRNAELLHKFTNSANNPPGPGGTTWTRWERFSDTQQDFGPFSIMSGPSVSTRGVNKLDVFVKGWDGSLYWLEYTGNANPTWRNLGKPPNGIEITSDPDSVSWDQNRIDVFVRGSDNQLYHKWCDNDFGKPCNNGMSGNNAVRDWGSWERVGPALQSSMGRPAPERLTSGPTVTSFAPDRLDIFVRGGDNQLYHTWTDNAGTRWGQWETIGGQITSDPDAVSFRPDLTRPGPPRIDVFAREANGFIMHTWWIGR